MAILQQLAQAIQALNTRDKARRAELQGRSDLAPDELDWLDNEANYTHLAELIEALEPENDPDAVFLARRAAGQTSAVDAALEEAATLIAGEYRSQCVL